MQIGDLLGILLLGAIGGMFGQGLRVVVGLKKASDRAANHDLSFKTDVLDLSRLGLSLFIGAIAGSIGIFTLGTFPPFKDGATAASIFFALIGIGYTGTDFIEGFMRRYIPGEPGRASGGALQPGYYPAPATEQLNGPAAQIIASCESRLSVQANAASCSHFVIAVAADFGVALSGTANEIVDGLAAGGWRVFDSTLDGAARTKAQEAAQRGELVIAGLKAPGNGHVVVVVARHPGDPVTTYPYAYWGKLNHPEQARRYTTLNYAWNKDDRDKLVYASRVV
jgi:hypothetical protein